MTPTPDTEERQPIYCTGGCDVCRDYARELGVPLIVPPPPAAAPQPTEPGLGWIESLHEDANGLVWTTKEELRAALARDASEGEA